MSRPVREGGVLSVNWVYVLFHPIVIESVDMKNYLNWLLTYENS